MIFIPLKKKEQFNCNSKPVVTIETKTNGTNELIIIKDNGLGIIQIIIVK
ncbi:MAG TPA: hypothetical protein VNS32_10860 [Flavisolibacter sp.]|nr:hypothetical protein [Flavisolibacter sp.]